MIPFRSGSSAPVFRGVHRNSRRVNCRNVLHTRWAPTIEAERIVFANLTSRNSSPDGTTIDGSLIGLSVTMNCSCRAPLLHVYQAHNMTRWGIIPLSAS